ncbi:MAG: hypothetical protein KC591_13195, partial [Gemmatimonadetes bacterium]|nr:hypothetical protein [Gemmatimonadota bacterium]
GGHGFVPRPAPVVEVEAPTSTEAGGPEAGVRETEVAATKGEASAPATQPDSATTPDSTASGPASGSVATISRGSFHGGETLTIPVPTEGEIYIRYGNPGGVQIESYFEGGNPVAVADSAGATSTSAAVTGGTAIETPGSVPAPAAAADSASSAPDTVSVGAAPASAPTNSVDPDTVRQWVRDELASSPPAPAPALTDEQVAEIERRLEARLAERMDALEARTPTSVPPSAPVAESPISREVSASSAPKSGGLDWRPDALRPYAGFGADDPNQFVLGAALDLLEVPGVPALRFGPELSLGFGESITTFLLAIDARYEVFELAQRNWTPYASLGGGVLIASGGGESSERGVLNVTWGLAARLGGMKVFAEHQGVDLFDWNRLAVGVERSLP